MQPTEVRSALAAVRGAIRPFVVPAVTRIADESRDPFRVLVSTMLSLRTKDAVTDAASMRLFALADTPRALRGLSRREIQRAIYPVCFYRNKTKHLAEVARLLGERHGDRVPATMEELLELPGVGRKTANLVLSLGHGIDAICVDTHVHRISNRWGFVRTKTPDDTERRLRHRLPRRHWIEYNDLLVTFGQNVCTPLSPWCSRCPLAARCERRGVGRSR
ncbi:MAG: endonuclease III [Planctomycetes bacterium]|nr:endonuclease III [Planctomycetota bacterium]MBI3844309.1 endonuclease III [Planctomycetota bacterium]